MARIDSLREFMPPQVEEIIHTQIDLDITNLTISDVMRNIDHTYPRNTIEREKVAHGSTVIAVLCKSEYLFPLKGVLLLVTSDDMEIDALSKKYAVILISEKDITTEPKIMTVNDKISVYLAKNYKEEISDFDMFYNRFLYNAYEAER